MERSGIIYLVSTPIGNLEDITFRAVRTLKESEYIFAEDTRKARILFQKFEIKSQLDSFHSYSKEEKIQRIIHLARTGHRISIISEAGTPGISDPAYKLVKEAIRNDIPISPIPGATAVVPAIIASGLPTDKFFFIGFLPQKKGRKKLLESLKDFPYTMVIYESVHKLEKTLKELANTFGNRYICIAREITKMHESFYRGFIENIIQKMDSIPLKGEFVLVIAGTQFKPIE